MHLVIEKAVREKFVISVGIAEIRDMRQKEKESSEISKEIAEVDEEIKSLIGDRRKELTGKEIVLTDSAKILCVYVHGDVEETKVTDSTKDVLLVAYGIPGMSEKGIKEGVVMASNYIRRFAGGEVVMGDVYE